MKLEIAGLEFSYDSLPVLKEVGFKLEEGEILTIVGPNASGKTTLLNCINNILEPDKGSILLDSKNLNELSMREIARKIGHVPQGNGESFPTTVFDTVLMGRKPHGGWKPSEKDLKVASETIDKLDLEDIAMRDIGELSGGQKQKVLIARALTQEPDVLLLDEPTSSLDLKHQIEVLDLIQQQTDNDISVVMTLHDLNLSARYSNKTLMLNDGEIFAAGGGEVLNAENIKTVFGVEVEVIEGFDQSVIVPQKPIE